MRRKTVLQLVELKGATRLAGEDHCVQAVILTVTLKNGLNQPLNIAFLTTGRQVDLMRGIAPPCSFNMLYGDSPGFKVDQCDPVRARIYLRLQHVRAARIDTTLKLTIAVLTAQ